MEEDICLQYLKSKSKSKIKDEKDLPKVLSLLTQADPDPLFSNCKWIIDSFSEGHFRLEDIQRVKDDLIKFQTLFGVRRHFPEKGYKELKKMNREKEEKEERKLTAKTTTKQSRNITFEDCKSYFKNVKNTLPTQYKSLPPEQLESFYQRIQDANPTSNFNNCIWIVEEIKSIHIKDEDLPEVKKYLSSYFPKTNLPLPNFYPQFPAMNNYQLVKDAVDGNVDLLSASDLGILLTPKTVKASCSYGVNTSWCTANEKDNRFEKYNKKGTIYTWFDKVLKDKYQFQFEKVDFKDRDNKSITKERFKEFSEHPILKPIFDQGIEIINPKLIIYLAQTFFKARWPEGEQNILKSGDTILIYEYAQDIIKGRWPEAEKIILESENTNLKNIVYNYAKKIIKGRWPEGEQIILKSGDKNVILPYAHDVIKGRWREAEPFIMKDPEKAIAYAVDVIDGRWPEAEPFIMKDPESAIAYAEDVIQGRWPKAEPFIMKDPESAYTYARDVIDGRWPEAEPFIMKDPEYAYKYARDFIRGRWPEAEPFIMMDQKYTKAYARYIK
jgi:hypothetical protein